MLCLTRKAKQSVDVDVTIDGVPVATLRATVLSIRGNRVELGFDAPRSVRIRRTELPPRPRPKRDAA